MPLPSDLQTGRVEGHLVDAAGDAAQGSVTFSMRPLRLVSPGTKTIVIRKPITVALDADGIFGVDLPATDDPDITPIGFTYQVEVQLNGGGSYTQDIAVPVGSVVDLSATIVVDPATGAAITRGPQGLIGPTATIAVGATTQGAPGVLPTVTNVGTPQAAVLDFLLPRGATGLTGLTGPTGANIGEASLDVDPGVASHARVRDLGVNVKAHGAVGDGVVDDTAAIQAAINQSATSGGRVFLPRASVRYRITAGLTVPPGCAGIEGVGSDFDGTLAASTIRADAGIPEALVIQAGGKKQLLRNFTLSSIESGNGTSKGLVVRASRLSMDNVTVTRFGSHNVWFDSLTAGTPAASCSVPTIVGCRSSRSGGYGWLMESNDANAGVMVGVDTVSNKQGGIRLEGASRWDITGHFAANGNTVTGGSYAVRGLWDSATTYALGDIVNHNGVGYIAKVVPAVGVAPTIGTEWDYAGFAIFDNGVGNRLNPYIESGIGHRVVFGSSSTWGVLDSVYYGPGTLDWSMSPVSKISWTIRRYNAHGRHIRIFDEADPGVPTNVMRMGMGETTVGVFTARMEIPNKVVYTIPADASSFQAEVPVVPRVAALNLALGSDSLRWKRVHLQNGADGGVSFGSALPNWCTGAGTPEGVVTARIGSLWTRTDGGAGTTLYVKESGTGTTGWVAK